MTLLPPSRYFPPPELAGEEGLLCIGGKLGVDWLLDAYRHGIFPWPVFEGDEVMAWWSPDPRAIFELDLLYISRRLRRTCRSGKFRVTSDRDFCGVIEGCATAQDRRDSTWLTPEMRRAYTRMHEEGYAHSIEVWREGELVGGTYGIALGAFFAAESMFYRATDASKVALVYLVAHLRQRGYTLLDIQQLTDHTAALGAVEISRRKYLRRLRAALTEPVTFGELQDEQLPDWL